MKKRIFPHKKIVYTAALCLLASAIVTLAGGCGTEDAVTKSVSSGYSSEKKEAGASEQESALDDFAKTDMIAIPGAAAIAADTNKYTGRFSIDITGVNPDFAIENVKAAVWCRDNAKDIYWYDAKKNSDGVYTIDAGDIANNKYDIGTYKIQVYAEVEDGAECFLGSQTMDFNAVSGGISYEDSYAGVPLKAESRYTINVSDVAVPTGVKSVEFSVKNETTDSKARKYKAERSEGSVPGLENFTVTVPVSDFRKLGQYSAKVYAVTRDGSKNLIAEDAVMDVEAAPVIADGLVSVSDVDEKKGAFNINIANVASVSGVAGVDICAWPESDPTKAAIYPAQIMPDGSYTARIKVKKHGYELGDYYYQIFPVMGNGVQTLTADYSNTFDPDDFVYVTKPESGFRSVTIKNPSGKDVKFHVINPDAGEKTEHWYEGKADGDAVRARIDLNKYHRKAGNYNVEVFSGDKKLAESTFTADKKEILKNGWYYEDYGGTTYKFYYVDDVRQTDIRGVADASGPYRAEINRACNTITIYALDGDNGYIVPVCAFACSVGLPDTPTPTGTYYTDAKYRWKTLMGPSYGQYVTHIVYGVYFHSVAGYNMTSYNLNAGDYNNLGQAASHGCVRLCVRDAKWMYDNCQTGMSVYIYDGYDPGPMGKPDTIKIPAGQNWDPTDPNI